ncbi:MAG: hypothetical protein CNC91_04775 [Flavobacteriales bacterium MED-G22]|nr:MAG: hypothetical protein CNC91_04775 [Flavobacteriales bacterium MED-G22]
MPNNFVLISFFVVILWGILREIITGNNFTIPKKVDFIIALIIGLWILYAVYDSLFKFQIPPLG